MLMYQFDTDTKEFVGVIESDKPVDNATEVRPDDGLYNPTWDGKEWVGMTLESFAKSNPAVPADPTPEQLMIAQLTLKVAKLEAKDE